VQVREDPNISHMSRPSPNLREDIITLQYTFKGDICWLRLHDGEAFGCLGSRLSRSIKRLKAFPCIELDCIVASSSLETAKSRWKKTGKPTELLVNLNVYGHNHSARVVGDTLADKRLFLQDPLYDGRSANYDNPQYLKLPDVAHISLDSPAPVTPEQAYKLPAEASRLEIEELLDHIPQPKILRGVFTNRSVVTVLKR
jgi:SWI/SNF-related matrix-associated actin-dependent regulator of chromatin subfamily A3